MALAFLKEELLNMSSVVLPLATLKHYLMAAVGMNHRHRNMHTYSYSAGGDLSGSRTHISW